MRTVATILIIFLVRCVYLYPTDLISNALDKSCIFGPASMSMILFNSANPEGKNIGEQEGCDYIDPSKPIYFVVHGFISSANTTNGYDLASKLVKKNSTVFSLDWSNAACKNGLPILKLLEYPKAVENTREIGKLMARYVISLMHNEKCNNTLDDMTFIGHSLGAHVCGFAAKHILNITKSKVKIIIAADAARPMFEDEDCSNKLCNIDADNVLGIHTSPLGIPNVGDFNMQCNGGENQPNCTELDILCQHSASLKYLIYLSDKCVYPNVNIENKSSLSFLDKFFGSKPSYPGPNTIDCIVINDRIFNLKPNDKLIKGNYYTFIDKKPPFCTQKSFSCNSIIIPAK